MLLQKTDAAASLNAASVSCRYFRGPPILVSLLLTSCVPCYRCFGVKNVQLLNLLCYCFYLKIDVQSCNDVYLTDLEVRVNYSIILFDNIQYCTKLYKRLNLASLGNKTEFLATLEPHLLHSKSKPTFATRFFFVNDEAEQHRESFVVLSSYQSQQKICGLLYPINKVRLHPKAASASLCEMCKGKKWRRGDEST